MFRGHILTTPEEHFFIRRNEIKPLEMTGKIVISDVMFAAVPHLSAMLLNSVAQDFTTRHSPRTQRHGAIGVPGCDEWATVLAVRASGFVSVQVPQLEALRAALVATRVPDPVAQRLSHKVPRDLHLTPTDGTRAATQARRALPAHAVSIEALKDGRPQQLVTHRTLQHILDARLQLSSNVHRHSTTTRPFVLPEDVRR